MSARRTAIALCLVLALLPACARQSAVTTLEPPYLMHVVLVWLKQPGHAEHRRLIEQAAQDLARVPGVRALRVGEVVVSDRAVVEDSYDVALSLRFDDAQALTAYLEHPLHVETVKKHFVPLMQRYQVIDFQAR